jgi:hypothetical protein
MPNKIREFRGNCRLKSTAAEQQAIRNAERNSVYRLGKIARKRPMRRSGSDVLNVIAGTLVLLRIRSSPRTCLASFPLRLPTLLRARRRQLQRT